MSAQVDVMAALRDDFVDASLTRMHDVDAGSKARRSEAASAAVAELIEAARHAREALAESKSDPITVGKLCRALARVQGVQP